MFENSGFVRKTLVAAAIGVTALFVAACAPTEVYKETQYSSSGKTSYKRVEKDKVVISELRRVFEDKVIEGHGIFENANEGLARRTAINLAVADLAGQIQTLVRSDSTIYNNRDVRDVVNNRVKALVNNYRIDFTGYDPGTIKYRARVSIRGEEVVREINRTLVE